MNESELHAKMDEGKYAEVFSEIRDYLTANPTDTNAKKLYNKLLNEYKKREQKYTFTDVSTKIDLKTFDDAIKVIDAYLEIIPDDKKALQLKERATQEMVKYEIDQGYIDAKEQFDLQNYTEALKILVPLVKKYKTEKKLLKLKEQAEKEKWDAQFTKWEMEAQEALKNQQFEDALKKVEMILRRDASHKASVKLREKILEEEKKTGKKKLWDEINTQIKIQNYSTALTKIQKLLQIDPTDNKAQKLQADIIEKEMKYEKKKVLDLATAQLKAYKFTDALKVLDEVADKFETDKDYMNLREKIKAEELQFKLDNLIGTAKQLIKRKEYEKAEEKIDEALEISNSMSKDAISRMIPKKSIIAERPAILYLYRFGFLFSAPAEAAQVVQVCSVTCDMVSSPLHDVSDTVVVNAVEDLLSFLS